MKSQPTNLRLYNTLSRSKQDFAPIDPSHVRMYVCGPTVYDYAHIGNARPVIVFDVLYRLLRYRYGADHVKYVRNITDVDDKINARAAERGISIRELTEETAKVFHQDVEALGCLPPDVEPRATDHIAEMIAVMHKLIDKGHAYAADGHVLFAVPSMHDYGQLARRSLDEMIAGARVEVASYKQNDTDFVLWKPSAENEPGWQSPWGRGRPGWHLECSAMSWKHLGETFDIHGGGIDLVFPHHENEIAQSRCAFGHDVMANIWMHNGFLQVEGEKMSKSLGNFITIHELLHTDKFGGYAWEGPVLRLAMLTAHYRQPIDWTVDRLNAARKTRASWLRAGRAAILELSASGAAAQNRTTQEVLEGLQPSDGVIAALADDLNTPAVMTHLAQLFATPGSPRKTAHQQLAVDMLLLGMCSAGELLDQPAKAIPAGLSEDEIDILIASRLAARKQKDWAESDRIRDELVAMGIQLMDAKNPQTGEIETTWEVKR